MVRYHDGERIVLSIRDTIYSYNPILQSANTFFWKENIAKFGDYRKVCDPKIRLVINSPLLQRDISLFSSDENLLLDQDNNFHLISLSILITVWCMMYGYYREKLHVNHFKAFKG